VVTSLALSFTNDHFEIESAALANASDLDHYDVLGPRLVRRTETNGDLSVKAGRREGVSTFLPPAI
jgi:hypothetical protein